MGKKVKIKINTKGKILQAKLRQTAFSFTENLAKKLAEDYNLPYLNLSKRTVSQDYLGLLTKEEIERSQAAIIHKNKREISLAVTRPSYSATIKTAQKIKKKYPKLRLKTYLISNNSLRHLLAIYKEKFEITKPKKRVLKITSSSLNQLKNLTKNEAKLKSQPAAEILNSIIAAAVSVNSSDIHFELIKNNTLIRFRVDGVLEDIANIPTATYNLIRARIKILSKLKLNIQDIPQDGSFSLKSGEFDLNFRVSALPGAYGENIVLRILSSDIGNLLKIEHLGMTTEEQKKVKESLELSTGAILLTGPTGSGKTTSLYAFLNYKINPSVKIITLEDPIEYRLEGISQIGIDSDEGLSFAEGLRGVLRQDPDIIMVGEIRDPETAKTLTQAANTGHLVFSTLHANSAVDIIQRLNDLGVTSKKVANTLKLLINQRLLRRLCDKCKKHFKLKTDQLKAIEKLLGEKMPKKITTYKARGCQACNQDGYVGRTGVFEIMQIDSMLAELISTAASATTVQNTAQKYQNMNTVLEAAHLKFLLGQTTLEEIERIF